MADHNDEVLLLLKRFADIVGSIAAHQTDSINTGTKSKIAKMEATARKHARSLFLLAGGTLDESARAKFEDIFGGPERKP